MLRRSVPVPLAPAVCVLLGAVAAQEAKDRAIKGWGASLWSNDGG